MAEISGARLTIKQEKELRARRHAVAEAPGRLQKLEELARHVYHWRKLQHDKAPGAGVARSQVQMAIDVLLDELEIAKRG